MIKVLYIRSQFEPGGTEMLLLNLFNYPQKKIQFHYIIIKNGSLISKLQSDHNKLYKVFRKTFLDLNVLKKIMEIIRNERITIIHSHQLLTLIYATILKLINPKLEIYHTIHGYFKKNEIFYPILEKLLLKFCKKVLTVSNATKNILTMRGYPTYKTEVLYNAVYIDTKATSKELGAIKSKIRYSENDFIIGMVGNFVWYKDQSTIIKAFNILKDKIPEMKLVFIGKETNLSENYKLLLDKKYIDSRVFFLGSIEKANEYISIFDVFIMATLMDTFGIAVIEALWRKIPVIASNINVMKELSHNGKYFDLFKSQDPDSLAVEIIKKYKCKDQKMTSDAAKYVFENFSYSTYIDNLLKIYTQ